jgi:NADH-quinone oxidoreductase subunit C
MTAPVPENTPAVPPVPAAVVALRSRVERVLGPAATFELKGALPAFRVAAGILHEAAEKLCQSGYDYLVLVTAVDYPAENRFELVYILSNFTDAPDLALVADVPRDHPAIPSVADLWATAGWHEREVFDMFGISFANHPDLRRILLDDTWEGYPLRKDYVDKVHDVVKRPY